MKFLYNYAAIDKISTLHFMAWCLDWQYVSFWLVRLIGRVSKQRLFIPNLLWLGKTLTSGAIRYVTLDITWFSVSFSSFSLGWGILAWLGLKAERLASTVVSGRGQYFGLGRSCGQNVEAQDILRGRGYSNINISRFWLMLLFLSSS